VRTEHRSEEDGGGEEQVPLHVEGFMREEILLDYLWRPNIVIAACSIFKEEKKKSTSRHTKSSSGSVVNIFSPKQNRAMLIRVSFYVHVWIKTSLRVRTSMGWRGSSRERSC
jgi:hypothetical protein